MRATAQSLPAHRRSHHAIAATLQSSHPSRRRNKRQIVCFRDVAPSETGRKPVLRGSKESALLVFGDRRGRLLHLRPNPKYKTGNQLQRAILPEGSPIGRSPWASTAKVGVL